MLSISRIRIYKMETWARRYTHTTSTSILRMRVESTLCKRIWDSNRGGYEYYNRRFGGIYPSSGSNKPNKIPAWKHDLPPASTLVSCSTYSTLKMEVICSSETSVDFRRTTRRYVPEASTPYVKEFRWRSVEWVSVTVRASTRLYLAVSWMSRSEIIRILSPHFLK
jgi:hypothetical protein